MGRAGARVYLQGRSRALRIAKDDCSPRIHEAMRSEEPNIDQGVLVMSVLSLFSSPKTINLRRRSPVVTGYCNHRKKNTSSLFTMTLRDEETDPRQAVYSNSVVQDGEAREMSRIRQQTLSQPIEGKIKSTHGYVTRTLDGSNNNKSFLTMFSKKRQGLETQLEQTVRAVHKYRVQNEENRTLQRDRTI